MTPFFDRLREYYSHVGASLKSDATAAKIFPNNGDNGTARESVYQKFLRAHVPAKCDVFKGGYLFDQDGNESRQIDIIVTNDTSLQFKHLDDKSFACVDGALACVSSKATLTQPELWDSLHVMASIPKQRPLSGNVLGLQIFDYDDFPTKIVFAADGPSVETTIENLREFYRKHPSIPAGRRPNLVHVAGKYLVIKPEVGEVMDGNIPLTPGSFCAVGGDTCDAHGLCRAMTQIQVRAMVSSFIAHDYLDLANNLTATFDPLRRRQ